MARALLKRAWAQSLGGTVQIACATRGPGPQLNLATRVVGPTLAVRVKKAAAAASELGAMRA
eukprot:6400253-Alexandrium_andersonii.AAC.1